jgi:hypothetical protein
MALPQSRVHSRGVHICQRRLGASCYHPSTALWWVAVANVVPSDTDEIDCASGRLGGSHMVDWSFVYVGEFQFGEGFLEGKRFVP